MDFFHEYEFYTHYLKTVPRSWIHQDNESEIHQFFDFCMKNPNKDPEKCKMDKKKLMFLNNMRITAQMFDEIYDGYKNKLKT